MTENNEPANVKRSSNEQGKIIGDNIKKIRIMRKMTQKELAELIGVSPSMIWQYENGYRVPRGEAFIRLVLALDVLGYDLVDGLSDFPMSAAMVDPLHYGDEEVLAFAEKIGKVLPGSDDFKCSSSLMEQLVAENVNFSLLIEPFGVFKAFVDKDEKELLKIYICLNDAGKAEAKKRIAELSQLDNYKRTVNEPLSDRENLIKDLYLNSDLV